MITYTDFETTIGETLTPILVARYQDDALGIVDERMHVFFPDCHLLDRDDAAQYPNYHFLQGPVFLETVQTLKRLAEAHEDDVRFFHLGDLFDLWRASPRTNAEKVAGIGAAFADAIKLLRQQRPFGLEAILLAGNHDFDLRDLDGWKCPRYLLLDSEGTTRLLLHGDVFAGLEGFPEEVKELGVRFAKGHRSGVVDLDAGRKLESDPGMTPDDRQQRAPVAQLAGTAGPASPRFNLTAPEGHGFFEPARTLVEELGRGGLDIRLLVIGHTHHARMTVGDQAGGKPFVLMDCGAWLGECILPGAATSIPSAQIGVACGNDLRIYQVTAKE
jgi:UDP-2,3-diacylglucosamine pyrophosphatase LpxH